MHSEGEGKKEEKYIARVAQAVLDRNRLQNILLDIHLSRSAVETANRTKNAMGRGSNPDMLYMDGL